MTNPEHQPETDSPERAGGPEIDRTPVEPRVYVASLSDYNNGILHGAWIDANQDPSDLWADVTAMLAASTLPGAEEVAIHDYEGFGPLQIGEHDRLDHICRIGKGIAEHGLAYAAWVHTLDGHREHMEDFEQYYRGHWDTRRAYVEELFDDIGGTEIIDQLPPWVRDVVTVNWESVDAGWTHNVDIVEDPSGGIWVFEQA